MTKFFSKPETTFAVAIFCIVAGAANIVAGNVILGVALIAIGIAI